MALKVSLFTHLATDAGCGLAAQLGPLVETHGLSMRPVLPHNMVAGFQVPRSQRAKSQKVAMSFL